MVTINGQLMDIAGKTIAEYLENTTYELRYIAVERNGDIVPKTTYATTSINDGDNIEIVSFVGGG